MWLSLEQMAELDRDSVVAKFATTACDRKTYQVGLSSKVCKLI